MDIFDVAFDGIGVNSVTMFAAEGVTATDEGKVGKIAAAKTIDVCDAEDKFYGVIGKVEESAGILSIDRTGFVPVSYTGTITPGTKELVADGSGGVKEPATAGTGIVYHIPDVNDIDKILYVDFG